VGRWQPDNKGTDTSAMGHTSVRSCGQAEGPCGVLLVGPGGWGDPQCCAHPSQGAGRGARGGQADPHLLPVGSECCWVEVPLLVCVHGLSSSMSSPNSTCSPGFSITPHPVNPALR